MQTGLVRIQRANHGRYISGGWTSDCNSDAKAARCETGGMASSADARGVASHDHGQHRHGHRRVGHSTGVRAFRSIDCLRSLRDVRLTRRILTLLFPDVLMVETTARALRRDGLCSIRRAIEPNGSTALEIDDYRTRLLFRFVRRYGRQDLPISDRVVNCNHGKSFVVLSGLNSLLFRNSLRGIPVLGRFTFHRVRVTRLHSVFFEQLGIHSALFSIVVSRPPRNGLFANSLDDLDSSDCHRGGYEQDDGEASA